MRRSSGETKTATLKYDYGNFQSYNVEPALSLTALDVTIRFITRDLFSV